jgi:hypothetical protein
MADWLEEYHDWMPWMGPDVETDPTLPEKFALVLGKDGSTQLINLDGWEDEDEEDDG